MRDAPSVTVAVLSYRRPDDLAAALPLLAGQADEVRLAGEASSADVLVVDNDAEESARPVVEAIGSPLVRYVTEPRRGISAGRNRALDECDSEVIVFVDDDERPHQGWLGHLLRTWRAGDADGVAGRVVSDFDGQLDPWISDGGFFDRRSLPTGTRIETAATNNLLLDLRRVRDLGVRFVEEFGLTGGGDTLFTRSLSRCGNGLVWCDEAVVTDVVPAARATRGWVLSRSARYGNSSALVDLWLAPGAASRSRARARTAVRGAGRVAVGGGRWGYGAARGSRRHRARGLRTFSRGIGLLAGACGLVYDEYATAGWRRRRLR